MRTHAMAPRWTTILGLLAVTGCEPTTPFEVYRRDHARVGALDIALTVSPDTVPSGGAFTVRLGVWNRDPADSIRLTSGCSVPAFFHLMAGADRVDPADGFACLTVVTRFAIAPGDSLTFQHAFTARDASESPHPPLAPGTYLVTTEWQIAGMPALQVPLVVR